MRRGQQLRLPSSGNRCLHATVSGATLMPRRMAERRNRSGWILAAAFVLGLLGWLVSPFWTYVALGGAVAGIGWTALVLVRAARSSGASTGFSTPAPESSSLPAADQYRALVSVEPAAVEDPTLVQAAAVRVFAAWVRQLPMPPRDPSGLVRGTHIQTRHLGRLTSTIMKRTLSWSEAALPGRSAVSRPPVQVDAIDPWAITRSKLHAASRHVGSCAHCAGQGNITCSVCNGTTKAKCSTCNGVGKAYGYAVNGSRRLLKCKSCRAKGEVDCTACSEGKVMCSPCRGWGAVEQWLEVSEASRVDVRLEHNPDVQRVFRWAYDDNQASSPVEADARVSAEISSEGPLSREELARQLPLAWVENEWQTIQPKLASHERVCRQVLQFLEIPAVDVTYSTGAMAGSVRFEGRRLLAPPMRAFGDAISVYASKLQRVRLVLFTLTAAIPLVYLFRGKYFWNGLVLTLVACAIGVAIVTVRFFEAATLARTTARRWGAVVVAGLVLACCLTVAAEPSLHAARRHLAKNRIDKARAELLALGKDGEIRGAELWADLHLSEALQTDDTTAIAVSAVKIPVRIPVAGEPRLLPCAQSHRSPASSGSTRLRPA
jgi:hypothetical protein